MRILLCAWLALLALGCSARPPQSIAPTRPAADAPPRLTRIEYYVWERSARRELDPATIQNLDVLIYFSLTPDATGHLEMPAAMREHLAELQRVLDPATELWLGLGSLDAVVADDTCFEVLVDDLRRLCDRHGFVGLDLDWEGAQVATSDYVRVVRRLSAALRSDRLRISLGQGSAPHYRQKSAQLADHIDLVNIQFYYSTLNSLSVSGLAERLAAFEALGLPRSKLCAGLPIYGMVDMNRDGDAQPISRGYRQMLQAGADPAADRWRDPANGREYHYSGLPLIRAKTRFLRENGYGGVFTWELSMDAPYGSDQSILRAIDEVAGRRATPAGP